MRCGVSTAISKDFQMIALSQPLFSPFPKSIAAAATLTHNCLCLLYIDSHALIIMIFSVFWPVSIMFLLPQTDSSSVSMNDEDVWRDFLTLAAVSFSRMWLEQVPQGEKHAWWINWIKQTRHGYKLQGRIKKKNMKVRCLSIRTRFCYLMILFVCCGALRQIYQHVCSCTAHLTFRPIQ